VERYGRVVLVNIAGGGIVSVEKVKATITVGMRSGHECVHTLVEKDWLALIDGMRKGMEKGVVMMPGPFGIHRVDEIDTIHFDFGEGKEPAWMRRIGF